jgi:enterochelin esterase-like enzyme
MPDKILPVFQIDKSGFVKNWLALGLFPNPYIPNPGSDGIDRTGFNKDFLESLGGESKAVFDLSTAVSYQDSPGRVFDATVIPVHTNAVGIVNLAKIFPQCEHTVAYLFCYLWSDEDRSTVLYFGSDDGAKIWVNGKLHASFWTPGRACIPRDNRIIIPVKQGLNPLLVKVDNATGAFAFTLEIAPQDEDIPWQGVKHTLYHSKKLGCEIKYCIYLPPGYESEIKKRYPVIYFLHGLTGNETTEAYLGGYADQFINKNLLPPFIMVYPTAGSNTQYTDSADGKIKARAIIIDELIPHIDSNYRTIAKKEGRAIQGMSMGGAGCLKLAFRHPELFSSVLAWAPAVISADEMRIRHPEIWLLMYGGNEKHFHDSNPFELVQKNQERIRGKLPIKIVCGTADTLIAHSRALHETLSSLKIPHCLEELEGFPHNLAEMFEEAGLKALQFSCKNFKKSSSSDSAKKKRLGKKKHQPPSS